MKKELISLLLVFAICLSLAIPSFASNYVDHTEITLSEYDMIVAERECSTNSIQTTNELQSNDNQIEEELLYRSTLDENTLKTGYGYSDEAIELIKSYDGTPLEYAPEMRDALSNVTLSLTALYVHKTYARLKLAWSWDYCPLVRNTDMVACAWEGVYEDGLTNEMQVNVYGTSASISYLSPDTGVLSTREYSASSYADTMYTINSDIGGIGFEFPMGIEMEKWAKSGTLFLNLGLLSQCSGRDLHTLSAVAEYAHYNASVNPSVSFSPSLSISFSPSLRYEIGDSDHLLLPAT